MHVGGHDIPTLLVGDGAYPIQSWLMKPFAHSPTLSQEQKLFNYKLSRVKIAFRRLKARWRRLSKQMDIHIDNVPYVVTACCVLHNFCEVHGDLFDEDWLQENADLVNSVTDSSFDDHHYGSSSNHEGVAIRNMLVEYLSS